MSLMIIGFFLVGVLLTAVVVDVSAAHLRRTSMNNLADGAALAAADAVQGEQVYTTGLDGDAVVDASVARPYVRAYLADTGAFAEYPGLRWTVQQDGPEVRVRVSAPLELPLSIAGFTDDATVAGEAQVRVRVS
ncbi:MAG: pilus assembly protein TadG-related protein [Nocardioidaceae bacterium]